MSGVSHVYWSPLDQRRLSAVGGVGPCTAYGLALACATVTTQCVYLFEVREWVCYESPVENVVLGSRGPPLHRPPATAPVPTRGGHGGGVGRRATRVTLSGITITESEIRA